MTTSWRTISAPTRSTPSSDRSRSARRRMGQAADHLHCSSRASTGGDIAQFTDLRSRSSCLPTEDARPASWSIPFEKAGEVDVNRRSRTDTEGHRARGRRAMSRRSRARSIRTRLIAVSRRAEQEDPQAPASAAATGPTPPPSSLPTLRSRTVGVVIPDITDPVYPPIIRGIEDGLARARLCRDPGQHRRRPAPAGAGHRGHAPARHRRVDPRERGARRAGDLAARGAMPVVTISRADDDRTFLVRGARRGGRHTPHPDASRLARPSTPSRRSPGRRRSRPAIRRYRSFTLHAQAARHRQERSRCRIRPRLQRDGRRALRRGTAGARPAIHRARLRQRPARRRRHHGAAPPWHAIARRMSRSPASTT